MVSLSLPGRCEQGDGLRAGVERAAAECHRAPSTNDNNLAPNAQEREADHAHLRACIDASAALGGIPVGTFIGRDPGRSVAENLKEAERIFPALVDYAGERSLRLEPHHADHGDRITQFAPAHAAMSSRLRSGIHEVRKPSFTKRPPGNRPWAHDSRPRRPSAPRGTRSVPRP